MHTYFVFWTYIANYSEKGYMIQADSPEEAAAEVRNMFGGDFAVKAKIYVHRNKPCYISEPPKKS